MLKSKIKCYCFYIPKTYAQPNSLKCFLLLDKLFFIFKLFNLSSFSLTARFKLLDFEIKLFTSSILISLLLKKNIYLQFFQRSHTVSCSCFIFLLTSSMSSLRTCIFPSFSDCNFFRERSFWSLRSRVRACWK